MHSSHSSNSISNAEVIAAPEIGPKSPPPVQPKAWWTLLITWLFREATGAVFIFSGFTKAIDPWGTLYKIEDYLAIMGLDIWPSLIKVGAFTLCAVEFIVGVLLCFGTFRRTVTWFAGAIMCFMLPLSLWIALYNPVPDCGCFGDAFIISNWATFWKNIFLTIAIIWLIVNNRHIGWLITPALQWIALVTTALFVIGIEAAGYFYQPLLDFRPYPVGSTLIESGATTEPEYKFIYEKDGERREFGEDDTLPEEDSGWVFIDRVAANGDDIDTRVSLRSEKNIRLYDEDGEDVTEEALSPNGDRLLLVMSDLSKVSIASTWKINSLYDWSEAHGIDMIAIVAAGKDDIEEWENLSMPEYPVYTAEDTVLKELVRGNPGVVFTRNGIIKWKSSLRSLYTDDFMSADTHSNPLEFARDDKTFLFNGTALYLAFMGCLMGFSFMFRVKIFRRKPQNITHDDMAPHEESSSPDTPAQ